MSNKKLAILGIVAVLMVVWAVAQSRISGRGAAEPAVPVDLIQGLDPAGIGGIVVGTGQDAVTLRRKGKGFVVAGKDNYPAIAREINKLITSCLDIKTGELYTDDKANHKDLGVAEEDAQALVKFLRPDSSLLTGIVIGKTREQGQGTYVRRISDDTVYVAPQRPWISDSAMNYIDQQLTSINRKDIEFVTVGSPNEVYTLRSDKDGKEITLEELPEGKKLKDKDYERVFTALTSLRFDDVQKRPASAEELKFDRSYVCKLEDSTVYTLKIAQKDDETYVSCGVEFTDKTPITKREVRRANEAELKEKEAKLLANDKAQEFSAKHKGWIYKIAEYKAENLTRKLSDLVEDEEKLEKSEESADANSV